MRLCPSQEVEKPSGIITRGEDAESCQKETGGDVMREKIERHARGLEGLSIEELSRGAEKLARGERRLTAALIAHIAEISRRKGHLELGLLRAS